MALLLVFSGDVEQDNSLNKHLAKSFTSTSAKYSCTRYLVQQTRNNLDIYPDIHTKYSVQPILVNVFDFWPKPYSVGYEMA